MYEILKETWWILVPVLCVVVWAVRVESMVKGNKAAIETIKAYRDDIQKIHEQMTRIQNDVEWIKELAGKFIKMKSNKT